MQLAKTGLARAMMDVSDGLAQDLGHICRASGTGAVVRQDSVPLSPAFTRVGRAGRSRLRAGRRRGLRAALHRVKRCPQGGGARGPAHRRPPSPTSANACPRSTGSPWWTRGAIACPWRRPATSTSRGGRQGVMTAPPHVTGRPNTGGFQTRPYRSLGRGKSRV